MWSLEYRISEGDAVFLTDAGKPGGFGGFVVVGAVHRIADPDRVFPCGFGVAVRMVARVCVRHTDYASGFGNEKQSPKRRSPLRASRSEGASKPVKALAGTVYVNDCAACTRERWMKA